MPVLALGLPSGLVSARKRRMARQRYFSLSASSFLRLRRSCWRNARPPMRVIFNDCSIGHMSAWVASCSARISSSATVFPKRTAVAVRHRWSSSRTVFRAIRALSGNAEVLTGDPGPKRDADILW